MVVAILGQDFPGFLRQGFQIFPTLFATLSHPGASGSSGICALLAQSALTKVSNYLAVYVVLNPVQFAQLQPDKRIWPDPYSERFGLRTDPIKASERAHYFMSWAPSPARAPEAVHIKNS